MTVKIISIELEGKEKMRKRSSKPLSLKKPDAKRIRK